MFEPDDNLEINQKVKYTNIRIVGKGTNGVVYYAIRQDGLIKKEVALKTLEIRPNDSIQEMVREAAMVSKINHSNIVFVNTTFIHKNHLFIEYDYVNGVSLSQFIDFFKANKLKEKQLFETRNQGTLPSVHQYYVYCCLIILQLLNGLRAAYEEIDFETNEPLRIVHRDLCPSNVLISRYGIVKVTDFGLAYKNDLQLNDQIVIGKLAYCSPEQLKGKGHGYDQEKGIVHQTTDIFSVGVIFYEILTMRELFPLDEMNIAMKKVHSHEGFIALRRHLIDHLDFDPSHADDKVPVELCHVIDKALKLNPKKRYQKYEEMQSDISKFMHTLDHRVTLWDLRNEMESILHLRNAAFAKAETVILKKT